MRRTIRALLAASVAVLPAAAWSEPATDAGAKVVEEAIRAHGPDSWSAPGLLRVSPDGEGYRLSFDTARAIGPGIAPWTVKDATPVLIGLKKRSDGLWDFDAAGDLRVATEQLAANRTNAVSLAIGTPAIKGIFDPAIILPRGADIGFADLALSLRSAQDSLRVAAKDFRMTAAVKDLPEGRGDLDADFAMRDVSATLGTFPSPEVKLSATTLDGTYRMGRIDLAGVAALIGFWQSVEAGKDVAQLGEAERTRLRAIFKAHLPIIDEVGGTAVASGLSLSQGGKGFSVERLDYQARWEGMSDQAAFVIGARIANAGVSPDVWPKELGAILPSAATLTLRLSGFNMGAMWQDAALLRTAAEQSLLPRDHSTKLMFPGGKIIADISETTAKSSFYDVTLAGRIELSTDRTALPVGNLSVTAKDFDRTVKYLQDNGKPVPIFGQAAFLALMMKGLGKAQPDGSLLWDIRFDASGKVTVNSQPLPM